MVSSSLNFYNLLTAISRTTNRCTISSSKLNLTFHSISLTRVQQKISPRPVTTVTPRAPLNKTTSTFTNVSDTIDTYAQLQH